MSADMDPSVRDWSAFAVAGDCRVPLGHLVSWKQAEALAIPHTCTEEDPCPTRPSTLA